MQMIFKIFCLIALFMYAGLSAATPFNEGEHYQVVNIVDNSEYSEGVVAFFSYACPFCYRTESVMEGLERDGITVARVPVHFGLTKNMPGVYAWFLMKELGLSAETHRYTFDIVHAPIASEWQYNNLKYMEDLQKYFTGLGVSDRKFAAAMKKVKTSGVVEDANDTAKRYKVGGTPSFLVKGKYMVAGVDDSVNGKSQLDRLLRHLLTL